MYIQKILNLNVVPRNVATIFMDRWLVTKSSSVNSLTSVYTFYSN